MMPETERSMLDRLNRRYDKGNAAGPRYVRAEHVKISTGYDTRRICDYMAMDLWTGGSGRLKVGAQLHGHEVKVSRSDWLTELRDPSKADAFRVYCDFWWLVVSDPAIVKPGELPEGWGLMVASTERHTNRPTIRVAVQATRNLDVLPMPRDLQGTLMRATAKTAARIAISQGTGHEQG
ncbi:hypothetical protein D9V32_15590 [Mycetocola tolaasinivorans]|uniref:Uncharacterized protein n=2 Tax=Mycetocola tolaasinivorans TaxID=76635 RepID=A0A3L6ZX91_9MICO|nr:hypothetical protein D9V32_15590 [Mycetocola tolaasinivorans]